MPPGAGRSVNTESALWRWELSREPACIEGLAYLARADYVAGNFIEVLRTIDNLRAYQRNGVIAFVDHDGIHHYEALSLLALGRVSEAERLLIDAVGSAATHRMKAEAAYNLGLLSFGRGDAGGAVGWFGRAIALQPSATTLPDALLMRATAELSLGQRSAAHADYTRWTSLAPRRHSGGLLARFEQDLENSAHE